MVGGGSAGGGVCDRGTGDSASEAFRCHGARIVDAPACWCGAFSTAQAVATCTVYRASCCSLHGWRHPEGRTDLPSAYSWECPVAPFGVLLLLLFRLGGALGLLPNRGDRLLVCGFLPLFFLVLLTLFLCLSPRGYRGAAPTAKVSTPPPQFMSLPWCATALPARWRWCHSRAPAPAPPPGPPPGRPGSSSRGTPLARRASWCTSRRRRRRQTRR